MGQITTPHASLLFTHQCFHSCDIPHFTRPNQPLPPLTCRKSLICLHAINKLEHMEKLLQFYEVQTCYQLPGVELFRYLQIKNFVLIHLQYVEFTSSLTPYARWCTSDLHSPGLISALYSVLLTSSLSAIHSYVTKWSTDLGVLLEDKDWI